MDDKNLKIKQELVLELEMKFEEVAELFSNETLNSMRLEKVVGGGSDSNGNCNCSKGFCINIHCSGCNDCKCINTGAECPENAIVCVTASLELPSINTPTLTKPSSGLLG